MVCSSPPFLFFLPFPFLWQRRPLRRLPPLSKGNMPPIRFEAEDTDSVGKKSFVVCIQRAAGRLLDVRKRAAVRLAKSSVLTRKSSRTGGLRKTDGQLHGERQSNVHSIRASLHLVVQSVTKCACAARAEVALRWHAKAVVARKTAATAAAAIRVQEHLCVDKKNGCSMPCPGLGLWT